MREWEQWDCLGPNMNSSCPVWRIRICGDRNSGLKWENLGNYGRAWENFNLISPTEPLRPLRPYNSSGQPHSFGWVSTHRISPAKCNSPVLIGLDHCLLHQIPYIATCSPQQNGIPAKSCIITCPSRVLGTQPLRAFPSKWSNLNTGRFPNSAGISPVSWLFVRSSFIKLPKLA